MIFYLLVFLSVLGWMAFEMYRAPMLDDKGKVVKPGKKLKNLFK